jgi:hypothetical protein
MVARVSNVRSNDMADEWQKEQVLVPGQRENMLPAGLELVVVASNLKYGTGSTRNDFLDMSKKDRRS